MFEIKRSNGEFCGNVFAFPVKVYYEDTDAGGIVYYANYLKFAERARSECLAHLGINQREILQNEHTGFVVRSCNIEYLNSAVLEDELTITCEIGELGAASLVIKQNILRKDEVLAKLEVKVINLNIETHRPTRIAPALYEKLAKLLPTD